MTKPSNNADTNTVKKSSTFNRILLLSLAVFFGLMFLPSVFYLLVAMLPTMAAYLMDKTPEKYEWICVGGLNFGGASPGLIALWSGRHNMESALMQIADIFNIMTSYGAAGLGWLLFVGLPPVIGVFVQMSSQRRIATLQATQTRLVQMWGKEVATHKGH